MVVVVVAVAMAVVLTVHGVCFRGSITSMQ
jgi:hypothetical protein